MSIKFSDFFLIVHLVFKLVWTLYQNVWYYQRFYTMVPPAYFLRAVTDVPLYLQTHMPPHLSR